MVFSGSVGVLHPFAAARFIRLHECVWAFLRSEPHQNPGVERGRGILKIAIRVVSDDQILGFDTAHSVEPKHGPQRPTTEPNRQWGVHNKALHSSKRVLCVLDMAVAPPDLGRVRRVTLAILGRYGPVLPGFGPCHLRAVPRPLPFAGGGAPLQGSNPKTVIQGQTDGIKCLLVACRWSLLLISWGEGCNKLRVNICQPHPWRRMDLGVE